MTKATTEELVSGKEVESLAILVKGREDDLKIHVMIRMVGDRYAYEAILKTDRSLFDRSKPTLDNFFDKAREAVRDVLDGKRELNAVIS